ncbi:MAG: hypothetical protein K1X42_14175 [Opitutaceae bacterium]|nr:hypothetical protein [Opitutaceae bacterium]
MKYTLMRRSAENPGNAGVPAPVESVRDDASELIAEQESIANVDTCIQQAAEALRTGRESVARSFFAQKSDDEGEGSDPRALLKTGRQRVIDQMKVQPSARGAEIPDNSATALGDLNRQLGEQVAKLAGDVTEGRTRPEVFKVQLRATLDTYRNSVERLFASRITINVR